MTAFRFTARRAALGSAAIAALSVAAGTALAQTQIQQVTPGAGAGTGLATSTAGEAVPEDVVVTGTSIRGIAPVGSNSIALTAADIVKTGALTTSELLATVPQLQSFGSRPRTSSGFGGVDLSPDLRGLGEGRTLTLINGHRLVNQGISQSEQDPTGIAPAAIERIEIVPDGASSIYGSDAIAGVVDVILRHDFDGVDIRGNLGLADRYEEGNLDVVAGKTWSGGSVLLSYQYSGNSTLTGSSRDYNSANLSGRGGPDIRTNSTYPPNVVINGVSYASPGLQPNTTNLFDQAKDTDIIPRERSHSVSANVSQDLGDRIRVFGDAEYSNRVIVPRFPIDTNSYTLTNANPFFVAPAGTNATSETVNYSFRNLLGPYIDNPESLENLNLSGGVDIKIAGDWKATIYGTYGWSSSEAIQGYGSLNGDVVSQALASTSPSSALDLFGDRTNPAVAAAISDHATPAESTQRLYQTVAKADGSVFDLPAGPVKLAFGFEARQEEYEATVFNTTRNLTRVPGLVLNGNSTRTIYSGFGETYIPIVSERNAIPGVRELTVSASGRFDQYDTFGSTGNPKVGLSYTPIEGIHLRGSYGTAFRAPAQSDSNAVDTRIDVIPNLSAPGALTPVGTTQKYNTLVLAGGNPNLKPETAGTYSVGIDFVPTFLENFRASGTYFHYQIDNVIGGPYGSAFTNPAFRQYYILNPTAAQVHQYTDGLLFNGSGFNPYTQTGILDLFNRYNLGNRTVSGIDYDISYNYPLPDGAVTAGVSGVTYLTFQTQSPGSKPTSNLSDGTQVKWRLRGSLGLKKGPLDATVFVNYVGPYRNPSTTPVQNVDAFTTVDLNIALDAPFTEDWKNRPQLTLNIQNLFDADPPFYNGFKPAGDGTLGGFNYQFSNPLGRFVEFGFHVPI